MSMRRIIRLISGAAARAGLTGILLLITPAFIAGIAAERPPSGAPACSDERLPCRPAHMAPAALDASDAQAALKAIHLGLTEIGRLDLRLASRPRPAARHRPPDLLLPRRRRPDLPVSRCHAGVRPLCPHHGRHRLSPG